MSAGGGQQFETVRVTGERRIDVGDGENLSNVKYVLDGPDARPRIFMDGASSVVNVGFEGECQQSDDGGVGIKIQTSGQALIDNVYLGDGCVPGHICPLFANSGSSGSVTIRHVNIQDWPDNAAYLSPVGHGGNAEMHFENCYFARCTSGLYRPSSGSMTNCVALNNSPGARTKLREAKKGGGKVRGSRAVWCREGGNFLVENSVLFMPHETTSTIVDASPDGSSVTVRNSLVGPGGQGSWSDGDVSFQNCSQYSLGDPLPWEGAGGGTDGGNGAAGGDGVSDGGDEPTALGDGGGVPAPPGVPFTADEAASGNASADGRTVPPGGRASAGGGGGGGGVSAGAVGSGPPVAQVDASADVCLYVEGGLGSLSKTENIGKLVPLSLGSGAGAGGVNPGQQGDTISGTIPPGGTENFNFGGNVTGMELTPQDIAVVMVDGEEVDPESFGPVSGNASVPKTVNGTVPPNQTAQFAYAGDMQTASFNPETGVVFVIDGEEVNIDDYTDDTAGGGTEPPAQG